MMDTPDNKEMKDVKVWGLRKTLEFRKELE